jgi:hypothetical protein
MSGNAAIIIGAKPTHVLARCQAHRMKADAASRLLPVSHPLKRQARPANTSLSTGTADIAFGHPT